MAESENRSHRSLTPSPFIVEPSSRHTHSLILLHGLGSNGEKFGNELLQTGVCSDGKRLTDILPGARFIFPTSKRRRSSAFGRAMLTQWFDIASLDDPSYRSHTQLQGLEESHREIVEIVNRESKEIASENIILGGLSQGCAMALVCLLSIHFPVGGFIGMSGWLPFSRDIEELVEGNSEEPSDDDPFSSDDQDPFGSSETEASDPFTRVLGYVRDLVSISSPETPSRAESAFLTPVFLGHGDADEKVRLSLGEEACRTMRSIGFQVEWRSYKEQGHWYKVPDEIDDIVEFIRTSVGWTLESS